MMPTAGRRSSPGVAWFPTIRIGAGRPRAAWDSLPSFLASPSPLTGAAIPLLMLGTWKRRSNVPAAEKAMAFTLAVSAVYIVGNESVANWQALWFSAGLLALALTLVQARDAPG